MRSIPMLTTLALLVAAGHVSAQTQDPQGGQVQGQAQMQGQMTKEDEASLRRLPEQFAAAWNKHDAHAMAALFADDADLVNPMGRQARGRDQIEKLFMEEHAAMMKGTKFTNACGTPRYLAGNLAAIDCTFSVTNMKAQNGKPLPEMKGMYTSIAMKAGNEWKIEMVRAMVPQQPPAQTQQSRAMHK